MVKMRSKQSYFSLCFLRWKKYPFICMLTGRTQSRGRKLTDPDCGSPPPADTSSHIIVKGTAEAIGVMLLFSSAGEILR